MYIIKKIVYNVCDNIREITEEKICRLRLMEKTLIMSLVNHHIYYITDGKTAFYIALPYQKFD